MLSHSQFFMTPWTVPCQAPLSMEFSRQEYWNELPFPSPGNLPNPGIDLLCLFRLLHWQVAPLPLCHLMCFILIYCYHTPITNRSSNSNCSINNMNVNITTSSSIINREPLKSNAGPVVSG